MISGSTGPFFTKFLHYSRYLIVGYTDLTLFSDAHGPFPWQPILGLKLAKSADSPSLVALAFQNGLEYLQSDLKRFICDRSGYME